MNISKKCTYGIRALLELVAYYPGGQLSIAEIAVKTDIPRKFLEQLLLSLNKAGILSSKKGSQGGYSLQIDPSLITMDKVFEALEGPLFLTDCTSGILDCKKSSYCKARIFVCEIGEIIKDYLKKTTLKNIYEKNIPNQLINYVI